MKNQPTILMSETIEQASQAKAGQENRDLETAEQEQTNPTKDNKKKGDHFSLFRIFILLGLRFKNKKIAGLSQSLAFSTIFSSVPILAIFFAILGKITQDKTAQANIKEFISVFLIPEYVNDVFIKLQDLSEQSLALGAIGLPTLMLAGIMLYVKVDSSINEIWETNQERQWFRNSLAFFMTIFFGPMLLVLILSIPPYLQTLPYYQEVIQHPLVNSVITFLIPLAVMTVGLGVLYFYIPNTRVRTKHAMTGAFIAAIFIQIANQLVGYYLKHLAKLDVIYGSLVTLPLILIWVFMLWLVVLTGATLAFVLQHHEATNFKIIDNLYNDESILNNALEVMLLLSKAFEEEESSLDIEQMSLRLNLHRKRLEFIVKTLQKEGLVSMLEPDYNKKKAGHIRYQLGRAAKSIHLGALTPLFFSEKKHPAFNEEQREALNQLAVHPLLQNQNHSLLELKENAKNLMKKRG